MKYLFITIISILILNSCSSDDELNALGSTSFTQLPSVTIGSQIWQSTNLDVTTYRDGTPIPQVSDPVEWAKLTTGAWCYYNNSTTNGTTYGKLYNWYAVAGIHNSESLNNPSLRKILAPKGWHIPTHGEWTKLTDFLGGENVAGGKMKSVEITLWQSPNLRSTITSGFNGDPGGYRGSDGLFNSIGYGGFWWSSTETNNTYKDPGAYTRSLVYSLSSVTVYPYYKSYGCSVRCLRD
jgi:uncharacterized protein (TIGR02145 family)